jgi:hypothetical protein
LKNLPLPLFDKGRTGEFYNQCLHTYHHIIIPASKYFNIVIVRLDRTIQNLL